MNRPKGKCSALYVRSLAVGQSQERTEKQGITLLVPIASREYVRCNVRMETFAPEPSYFKEHLMKQFQSLVAVLCVLLVSAPGTYAQQKDTQQGTSQRDTTPRLEMERPHWYSPLVQKYEPKIVPPVNVSNTGRIESLLRAGQLYLSLQDTIALAVENNVDVEVQRYQFPLAQADLLRARAGSAIRGISTSTAAGSASAASPSLTSSTTGTSNFTSGGTTGGGTSGLSGSGAAGAGLSFDPALTGTLQWGHQSSPSQNTITTGTTAQILTNKLANFSLSQGFLTGATASLSYTTASRFQMQSSTTITPSRFQASTFRSPNLSCRASASP